MDEAHLLAAARDVPMNPVRARLAARPGDWPWSSARAHLAGRDDPLVTVKPLLDRIEDVAAFLAEVEEPSAAQALRAAEPRGRPGKGFTLPHPAVFAVPPGSVLVVPTDKA